MKDSEAKLMRLALDSFIEVCSDLHEHGLDTSEQIDDEGELLPIMRRAYQVLTKLEKARMVEFNEPGVYARILKGTK